MGKAEYATIALGTAISTSVAVFFVTVLLSPMTNATNMLGLIEKFSLLPIIFFSILFSFKLLSLYKRKDQLNLGLMFPTLYFHSNRKRNVLFLVITSTISLILGVVGMIIGMIIGIYIVWTVVGDNSVSLYLDMLPVFLAAITSFIAIWFSMKTGIKHMNTWNSKIP